MKTSFIPEIRIFTNKYKYLDIIDWLSIYEYHANNKACGMINSESMDLIRALFKSLGISIVGLHAQMSYSNLYPQYKGIY